MFLLNNDEGWCLAGFSMYDGLSGSLKLFALSNLQLNTAFGSVIPFVPIAGSPSRSSRQLTISSHSAPTTSPRSPSEDTSVGEPRLIWSMVCWNISAVVASEPDTKKLRQLDNSLSVECE
jgi:hypothetical protein